MFKEMNLSNANDRLIALTGIINVFRPFFKDNYAGLWKVFLPFELLWYVEEKSHRVNPDQAPTWSWQSLDCKVTYGKCHFDQARDIVENL